MMSLESRRVLVASLIEIRELWHELETTGNPNAASVIKPLIFERARRLETNEYFDRDSPTPPPHFG